MRVSCIVPARNEERCIGACIDALRVQAREIACEILVVDNGSTDGTAVRALAHGAKVVSEPISGLANARRAGAAAAAGEFLIYVDADTRLPAHWIADVVRRFEMDARLVAISPGFAFHDGRKRDDLGALLFRSALCPIVDSLLRLAGQPGVLIGSAIVVRAEAFRRVGGVDARFQFYGEDTALAYRLHAAGAVRFARGPVYRTSARRYQRSGLLPTVHRYFAMFALIHLGKWDLALRLAAQFRGQDQYQPARSSGWKQSPDSPHRDLGPRGLDVASPLDLTDEIDATLPSRL